MTGKFEKYAGKFEIEVGGEKLDLDVRLKDVKNIMAHQKRKIDEEAIQATMDVFLEILKRSYKKEKKKNIEAFLTRNYTDFLIAFSDEMGWASAKDLEKKRSELKKRALQPKQSKKE